MLMRDYVDNKTVEILRTLKSRKVTFHTEALLYQGDGASKFFKTPKNET